MKLDRALERKLLLGATVLSLALWVVPGAQLALWPLTLFNTYIHELSHGIANIMTGGQIDYIGVNPDGSGVTWSRGGSTLITASAGYVGSSLVGGLILRLSTQRDAATKILFGLGVIFALALVLVVRGNLVGWLVGAAWAVALIIMSKKLNPVGAAFAVRFLGITLCLTSIQAVLDLILLTREGTAMTDAHIMSEITLLPPGVFAIFWAMFSVVAVFWGLRKAWSGETSPAQSRVSTS